VFIQGIALVALLAWVLQAGVSPAFRERRRAFDAPLLALLGISGLSLLVAVDPGPGLVVLIQWSSCAAVYFVTSRAVEGTADARRLAAALLLGGAAVALVGLAQVFGGLDQVPQAAAPASTLANRNVAAAHLVVVLPLALWVGGRPVGRARWAVAALALVITAFLPFTQSRLALLTLAAQVVVVAMAFSWRRSSSTRGRWAGATLTAVACLVVAAGWLTIHDPAKTRSLGLRMGLARSALEMVREHPLAGLGLGSFAAEYPRFGPVVRATPVSPPLLVESPHNELLQLLAESGVGGGLALLWLAATVLVVLARLARSPQRGIRRLGLAVGLSLLGLSFQLAGEFPLRTPVVPLVAAILLGVIAALEAREGRSPPTLGAGEDPAWRWMAAAGVALVLALSVGWSARRLSADRSLARLHEALASGHEAEAVFQGLRSVRLDPTRPELRMALARAWMRAGRPAEAGRVAHDLLTRRPWGTSALGTLGVARLATGDRRGAAELFAAVLQIDPLDTGAREGLADASRQARQGNACPPEAELAVREGGGVDLVVNDSPLDEVLRCLSERAGFELEFDGPAPTDGVSLVLRDEPLTTALDRLFEGLAVDYLLGFDPSGQRVERLIVVSAAGDGVRPPSPQAQRSPTTLRRPRPRPVPGIEGADDVDEEFDPAYGAEESVPEDEPGYDPGSLPEFPEPEELSPMTRRPDPMVTYAIRWSTVGDTGS
jgi:hypothetical protein